MYDVNGWNVLKKCLYEAERPEEVTQKVFGDKFDPAAFRSGELLLDHLALEALISELDLKYPTVKKLLNTIITARSRCGCDHSIEEIKSLFCKLASTRFREIPCAMINILLHFQPVTETLHSFVKRVSPNTLRTDAPLNSCALQISEHRMTSELQLPPGATVFVNGKRPARKAELALFQSRDRKLHIDYSLPAGSRVLWTVPVIQIIF